MSKNNPHNIKLGQVLVDSDVKEYTVTRIGNKYFYVNNNEIRKFTLDKLQNKVFRTIQLYIDKQTIIDRNKKSYLNNKFSVFFSWNGKQKELTLTQLKAIDKIISNE